MIMAGSQAPYIHVIVFYVVSITKYINQPLVRLTTIYIFVTVKGNKFQ